MVLGPGKLPGVADDFRRAGGGNEGVGRRQIVGSICKLVLSAQKAKSTGTMKQLPAAIIPAKVKATRKVCDFLGG